MCLTMDQFEQACGFLLLNEYNEFVYYCKRCQSEFKSGSFLEAHILSEYHDNKRNIFVNDGILIGDSVFESTPDENLGEFYEYYENDSYEDGGEYENRNIHQNFIECEQRSDENVSFNEVFDRNCINSLRVSETLPTKKPVVSFAYS